MNAAATPPASEAPISPLSGHFADRLHAAISGRVPGGDAAGEGGTGPGVPACIGLDPVVERLPAAIRKRHASAADQIEHFCTGIIEAIAGTISIVKPQSACFERFGQSGQGALRRVIQSAHAHGMLVILDAKRGDIGATAEHYAAAMFGPRASTPGTRLDRPTFAADAVTLNGWMGMDTVEPFLEHDPEAGVFVLVRTSNPGSDALQAQRLADGRTVAEAMAEQVAVLGRLPANVGACGLSRVGAVVGATKSSEAAALRERMPDQYFLVPGFGAQGGTIEDLRPMLRTTTSAADAGIVVNASRSVIYAFEPGDAGWARSVGEAARRLADDLRTLF